MRLKKNDKKAKWMQGHDFLDCLFSKTYYSSPACINLFSFSTKRKKMDAVVCFRTGEGETPTKKFCCPCSGSCAAYLSAS